MSWFATTAETRETHRFDAFKTMYFKTSYPKVKEVIKRYALEQGYSVKSENDTHGELFLQAKRSHMIVTIVQVRPQETAVDVKVQSYRIIGLKQPQKTITHVLSYAQHHLPFKGRGLNPQ